MLRIPGIHAPPNRALGDSSDDESDDGSMGKEAANSGKYGMVYCPKTGKDFWLNYACI